MKCTGKISLLTIALLLLLARSSAQRFVPFGDGFRFPSIVAYNESLYDQTASVTIAGHIFSGQRFFATSINTDAGAGWRYLQRGSHYSAQLGRMIFRNAAFYFFADTLHYYEKVPASFSQTEVVHALDSIKQADRIQSIYPVSDSLIYAVVDNHSTTYLVKKAVNGNWQTIPLVVEKSNKALFLKNSILVIALSLFLLAVMIFLLIIVKEKQARAIQKGGEVEEDLKLREDRPLNKDQLVDGELKQAITAIANVIANRNTPMPMTIAINGAWGSGKSSIMNCIRQMLEEKEDKRFITTWFNAWHQQSESSLLNAFLMKVIRRCEQPFFRRKIWDSFFASLKFRTKLATKRFTKQPVYKKLLTGFTIVLFSNVVLDLLLTMRYNIHGRKTNDLHILNYTIDWNNLFSATDVVQSVLTVVLPIISFLFLQSEKSPTLGAFASIIYKKNFALEAEKKAPDLREKFRSEYWEIMGALGDKTLVVFIDDLDRVGGGKIFEMLEALNFISDVTSRPDDAQEKSFRAVFVLGLYVDQVAENLGRYLIDSKENFASSAKERPAKLGQQYLEKMIQLNVPVPLSVDDITQPSDLLKHAY